VGQFVLLPAVLRKLSARHPDFELEIQDLTTEQQIARLPEGKVDMLLMVGALPIRDMVFDPIGEDALVAVLASNSPLARKDILSIEDLRDQPIIASRAKDCRFHQPWLHSLFAPFGITPRIAEAPQSCTVQMAYAAAGEGVVIAAESMSLCMFPDVVSRAFREQLPGLQLGLASMQGNESRSIAIFRRIVMECAEEVFRSREVTVHRPISVKRPLEYRTVEPRQQAS
jgi:DNA-binding transcriptional LysR family regulator